MFLMYFAKLHGMEYAFVNAQILLKDKILRV